MDQTPYKTTTMEVSSISNVKVVAQDQTRRTVFDYYQVALRLTALLLTLTAAILAGVDKETTSISITLVDGTPPIEIPVKARWQYLSAFVYFVAANAIVCTYAAASLVLTIAMKQNTRATLAINILDIMILGLLYSANGAATGVGLIARNGNSHAQWNKVCPMVEGFCHRLGAAIFLSLLGSVVFVWLVVLTVMSLHRKSR